MRLGRILAAATIAVAPACSLLFDVDGLDADTDRASEAGSRQDGGAISDGGALFVVASGQGRPHWIALDEDAVYWNTELVEGGDAGAIVKLGRLPEAGPPARLVSGLRNAILLHADSLSVYWAVQNSTGCTSQIRATSKQTGGQGRQVVNTCYLVKDFTLDATNVYWVGSAGELSRVAKDGTGLFPMRTNDTRVTTIATDQAAIYFADDRTVKRIDKGGTDAAGVPFATGQQSTAAIATDDQSVFWITDPAGTVCRLDRGKTSADIQILARDQRNPTAIALDTNNVYWTNAGDGTVMQVPKSGGPVTVLATAQRDPSGIAADDRGVYWTNRGDGTIGAVVR
jgi:hypothetical protein